MTITLVVRVTYNDENNNHQPAPIIIAVHINIIWIDVVGQEKIETKPIVNLSMTMFASSPLETGWREE